MLYVYSYLWAARRQLNATGVSRRTTRDGSEDGQDAQHSRVHWRLKVVLPSESKHMEFNNFMATNLVSMTPNSFVEEFVL